MPMNPQIGVSYLPVNSRKQRTARRRIVLIAALAALAGASAVTGALIGASEEAKAPPATLPYS